MTRPSFPRRLVALATRVLLGAATIGRAVTHDVMYAAVAARNAMLNALVTLLGGSATMKFYNGTRPASGGALSGNTLLATVTFGATAVTDANGGSAGGVSAGVLTFGGYTQTNGSHVNGTPTWVRIATSGGTQELDIDIGSGAGTIGFSGSIVTGQNITGVLTYTAGNVGP